MRLPTKTISLSAMALALTPQPQLAYANETHQEAVLTDVLPPQPGQEALPAHGVQAPSTVVEIQVHVRAPAASSAVGPVSANLEAPQLDGDVVRVTITPSSPAPTSARAKAASPGQWPVQQAPSPTSTAAPSAAREPVAPAPVPVPVPSTPGQWPVQEAPGTPPPAPVPSPPAVSQPAPPLARPDSSSSVPSSSQSAVPAPSSPGQWPVQQAPSPTSTAAPSAAREPVAPAPVPVPSTPGQWPVQEAPGTPPPAPVPSTPAVSQPAPPPTAPPFVGEDLGPTPAPTFGHTAAPAPNGADQPAVPGRDAQTPVKSPVTGSTSGQQGQLGVRSGLPFDSGVFAHSPDRVQRYEQAVGRPVDVWQVAPQREEGFEVLLSETKRIAEQPPQGANIDLAIPLLSREEGRQIGAAINGRFPTAYVRPGWEFNLKGSWAWTTDRIGEQVYVQRFQATVDGLREGCPECQITWNPNTGQGGVEQAMKAWPGDSYVDVIGIDAYDWGNEDPINGPGQLNDWAEAARKLGKPVSLPEWGAHGKDGRGDNPKFVADVLAWAERNRDIVKMMSYFDEPESYIENSVGDGQMPQVGAALRQGFSAQAIR